LRQNYGRVSTGGKYQINNGNSKGVDTRRARSGRGRFNWRNQNMINGKALPTRSVLMSRKGRGYSSDRFKDNRGGR